MLQLLQPIWLWAIAGIVVPIIIHLWNVKQGKTLKVGSIAFLTESARSHSTSLKLSELLLLLLRCLLVIILALLLIKPFWEKEIDITNEKGWILIDQSEVKNAYQKHKTQIDSLIKSGFSFHYFNIGFEKAKFDNALKAESSPTTELEASYWSLLKELNQKIPAKLPVYLYTNEQLQYFAGQRPSLDLNLNWVTYTTADTISSWIENAFETSNDSIQIIVGNGGASGTFYTHQNISYQTSNQKFDVMIDEGKTLISYKDSTTGSLKNTIEVDTITNIVTIYTDRFATDASYVKAAIDAIRDFTHRKIKTSIVTNVQAIPESNWLFWLSENEIPSALKTNNSFIYQKGKVQQAYSTVVTGKVNTVDAIASFNTIESKPAVEKSIIWSDGFGQPLLTREKTKDVYCFYSRFNPQWNDLPWSNQFPEVLYNLLYPKKGDSGIALLADKRLIDQQQIIPTSSQESSLPKQELLQRTDLTKALWIIAFILLLAERIISFRRKKFELSGSIAR